MNSDRPLIERPRGADPAAESSLRAPRHPALTETLVHSALVSGLIALLFAFVLPAAAFAESGLPRSERPDAARVYLISPSDGEVVTSPVTVRFGLDQMGVAPAGVAKKHTGHHHLIVDAELPPADLPIPKNEHYRHFGGGQTETAIELPPGKHTLQLMLGDHLHIPHDPPVASERITIEVR